MMMGKSADSNYTGLQKILVTKEDKWLRRILLQSRPLFRKLQIPGPCEQIREVELPEEPWEQRHKAFREHGFWLPMWGPKPKLEAA